MHRDSTGTSAQSATDWTGDVRQDGPVFMRSDAGRGTRRYPQQSTAGRQGQRPAQCRGERAGKGAGGCLEKVRPTDPAGDPTGMGLGAGWQAEHPKFDRPEVEARSAPVSRLLRLTEAASYLSVSYWTVRDLVARGAIPPVRLPGPGARDGRTLRRVLLDRRDLDRLIENNKDRSA
jgi:excisionase family DNA binding protein